MRKFRQVGKRGVKHVHVYAGGLYEGKRYFLQLIDLRQSNWREGGKDSMQAAGVKPSFISYTSLISVCANGGKREEKT